jgi:hypothetical protein
MLNSDGLTDYVRGESIHESFNESLSLEEHGCSSNDNDSLKDS